MNEPLSESLLDFKRADACTKQPAGMTATDARAVFELLVSATLSVADGACLLSNMAARGETAVELAAWVQALRAHALACPFPRQCLDVCGTGGSGLTRFNVSTTAAFICASLGIPVAKHGNRGSQRPNGSFDMLDALGVNFALSPVQLEQMLAETNLCFLFARRMHPAVGAVVPYRQAAGGRSIFNLAGPLANPAAVSHQVIGCINERTADVLIEALRILGRAHACVVWGEPGIDEFSVTGASEYYVLNAGVVERHSSVQKVHAGLDYASVPGGDAPENAEIFHGIINGTQRGALRDMVLLNAGAAIDIWQRHTVDLGGAGYAQAQEALESGAVRACFEQHRALAASFVV